MGRPLCEAARVASGLGLHYSPTFAPTTHAEHEQRAFTQVVMNAINTFNTDLYLSVTNRCGFYNFYMVSMYPGDVSQIKNFPLISLEIQHKHYLRSLERKANEKLL